MYFYTVYILYVYIYISCVACPTVQNQAHLPLLYEIFSTYMCVTYVCVFARVCVANLTNTVSHKACVPVLWRCVGGRKNED